MLFKVKIRTIVDLPGFAFAFGVGLGNQKVVAVVIADYSFENFVSLAMSVLYSDFENFKSTTRGIPDSKFVKSSIQASTK
jgi:GTP-binding protein EngB required for normal cell division